MAFASRPRHSYFTVAVLRAESLAGVVLAHLSHESVWTIAATFIQSRLPTNASVLTDHVIAVFAPQPVVTRGAMAPRFIVNESAGGSIVAVLATHRNGDLTTISCPLAGTLAL